MLPQRVQPLPLLSLKRPIDLSLVLTSMPPSVLLLDATHFQDHLARHRQQVLQTIASLTQQLSTSNYTDSESQNALKQALAKNNAMLADIKRLTAEKEDRDERLTDTMMRLLSLEKKLDRSKSVTLAKIEARAHQRVVEESQEQEVVENDDTPSRPSSRVCPPSPCAHDKQPPDS
jgi:E3 ubiquitin-protein ligase BRE1